MIYGAGAISTCLLSDLPPSINLTIKSILVISHFTHPNANLVIKINDVVQLIDTAFNFNKFFKFVFIIMIFLPKTFHHQL
jgi:hypothetical protein